MRFHYISPSVVPSRTANAVHVIQQCDALARVGAEITLYAKRSIPDASQLVGCLNEAYGVNTSDWRLISYYSRISRADTLRIAARALITIFRGPRPDAVLSRNLYAAYMLAVVQKHPLLFETHQLEYGFRKALQREIMTRPWVTTVAISELLLQHLADHHGVLPSRPLVLHDAAPTGMHPIAPVERRKQLMAILGDIPGEWRATCAYFGHLYPGRGIEIIEAMARTRPNVLFLVIGGNEEDIAVRRKRNTIQNLVFLGHMPHSLARRAMVVVDVLLMPYQANVSIGVRNHDTAGWMSPMKMFEYLASGVPVISSDLPALREVLVDERNALLVQADDIDAWTRALDRLLDDPEFASKLGTTAHTEYLSEHTWDRRADALLAAVEAF